MTLLNRIHRTAPAAALIFVLLNVVTAVGQQKSSTSQKPLLTQKFTRHDTQRLGYGGTVSIVGPPQGSIRIEGWANSEVDVVAEVELQAETEDDLKRLATVNGFAFDEDLNHLRLLTTGTHDKNFMRRVAKGFPKKLLGMPWRIDYRLRVPVATDLEIDAGRGPIEVTGVEGALRISATDSETRLVLTGGTVNVTIATGKVRVAVPVRSWRGSGAEIRLGVGEIELELAAGFSAEVDAEVLRHGSIEDQFGLTPRMRSGITPTTVKARAGVGGAYFHFVVGDGNIKIKRLPSDR
jgi:hypothetical protein